MQNFVNQDITKNKLQITVHYRISNPKIRCKDSDFSCNMERKCKKIEKGHTEITKNNMPTQITQIYTDLYCRKRLIKGNRFTQIRSDLRSGEQQGARKRINPKESIPPIAGGDTNLCNLCNLCDLKHCLYERRGSTRR